MSDDGGAPVEKVLTLQQEANLAYCKEQNLETLVADVLNPVLSRQPDDPVVSRIPTSL